MKKTKTPFFKKIKNAIMNFDEYINFADEKISSSIKYVLKLVFIFALIITIALTYKVVEEANNMISEFKEECPEFKIENNNLIVEGENNRIIKSDQYGYFGLIVDTNKDKLSDIEETLNYQRVVAVLKDRIIIKSVDNVESSLTYEQLEQRYGISNINKNKIVEFLSANNMTKIYIAFSIILLICSYIIYLTQIIFDILLLSLISYLLSRIIGIKFKYKSIFNISVYALTLSIILCLVYMVINLFTGFVVKYFEIAYDAIAYIYIVTAMLMMKSDLIKQRMELQKIVNEQKKIREEKEKQNKDKKEDNKKPEKKKEKEEDHKENPEGSQA